MRMKEFIRNIGILAFSLFAGFASGFGTEDLIGSHGFEGLGIIVGILVLLFVSIGLREFLENMDKK